MKSKINVEITNKTQAKTKLLVIEDYKQQLEQLKQNKSSYEYKEYRYKYILLVNAIKYNEKQYKKLMDEQNSQF